MKKNFATLLKSLFLLLFVLFFSSLNCFSQQTDKFPAQFHYSFKTGRFQKGDDVTLTFMLTDIKSIADYEYLYTTFSKQDRLKKVVMSPYDQSNGSALCSFTFLTPKDSPFKPNYLEKLFIALGVPNIYFDNDLVETKDIVSYMLTKEKQEQKEK